MYDNYIVAMNKQRIILNESKLEKDKLDKEIKTRETTAKKLLDNITSGVVEGAALKAMSDKYNALNDEINNLKSSLTGMDEPKTVRILTIDYFRTLCKRNSKLLAHSFLPQKRAFVERCIEAVILDPVRKEVHLKLNLNPLLVQNDKKKLLKNWKALH